MNLKKNAKLRCVFTAILAWTFLGGAGIPETEALQLDPIAAADVYETDDSVILPMDSLRATEKVAPEGLSRTLDYIEKTKKGEMSKREPLSVIEYEEGIYSIIDGNKTYLALKELGAENVPALVVDDPYHKEVETLDDLIAINSEAESEFHELAVRLAGEYKAELSEQSDLGDAGLLRKKAEENFDGDYGKVVDVLSADLTVPSEDLEAAAQQLREEYYVLCMRDHEKDNGCSAFIRLSNGAVAEISLITAADGAVEPSDSAAGSSDTPFAEWNEGAEALDALTDYVEAVTDEKSEDFIPEEDRIAVFDMDGTLIGELFPTYLEVVMLTRRILSDPSWSPDEEMLEFGRLTRDHAPDKSFPDDYDYEFSYHQAKAFAGMTLDEYAGYVKDVLAVDADGFEGMTYGEAFYIPMAEVLDYLKENGFRCYVVSGADRFIVRTVAGEAFNIPSDQIIGSDTALAAAAQGDTDGIEYEFSGDDTVVRTDRLLIKDLKMNKVIQIAQEIGKQPVLSFGNSSGDAGMNNYALLNNPYRSAAFMLVADDDARDYGNPEKGAELTEKWKDMGYHVISMRDDWKTIYGNDVKKTGEFHWLEDYSDDNIPLRNPETESEAETEDGTPKELEEAA